MAPAAAELEAFSATEDAFRAAQLPEPPVDDENAPLGSDVWGRYVYHILRLSGVELKLARRTAKDDESYWNAAQIVSDDTLKAALDVEELNAISMVKGDQYLGLQVKLSGACEWHITCTEEIPDRRAAAAAARSRRSTAARSGITIENRATYEIALDCSNVVPDAGLRTTMVVGDYIAINVVFVQTASNHISTAPDGHPYIAQRRIDLAFTNRNLLTMQVCSMFCFVLFCSVLFCSVLFCAGSVLFYCDLFLHRVYDHAQAVFYDEGKYLRDTTSANQCLAQWLKVSDLQSSDVAAIAAQFPFNISQFASSNPRWSPEHAMAADGKGKICQATEICSPCVLLSSRLAEYPSPMFHVLCSVHVLVVLGLAPQRTRRLHMTIKEIFAILRVTLTANKRICTHSGKKKSRAVYTNSITSLF
jgi:hypothetical protein